MDNKTSNDSEITVRCGCDCENQAVPSSVPQTSSVPPVSSVEQPTGTCSGNACPSVCPTGSCPGYSAPSGDQHSTNPLLSMLSAMGFPNFGHLPTGDRDGCSRPGRTVTFREDDREDTHDDTESESTTSSHQDRLDDAWQLVSTLVESHRKICDTVSSLVRDLLDEDETEEEDDSEDDEDESEEEHEPVVATDNKRQDSVEIVDSRNCRGDSCRPQTKIHTVSRRRRNRQEKSSEEEESD